MGAPDSQRRIVVISGASRGIGHELARRLSDEYDVVGFARDKADCVQGFTLLDGIDVTDKAALRDFARSLDRERLWGVVACAGIASMNHFLSMPERTRRRLMDVNFHGVANFVEVFSGMLIKQRAGRIVALSTIAVPLHLEGEAAYVASKSAVEGYVRVVAEELAAWGVTANLIRPGPTDTELLAGLAPAQIDAILARQTIKRMTTFDDLETVCRFFLSAGAGLVTGQTLTLGMAG